jgi:hypothetical protein
VSFNYNGYGILDFSATGVSGRAGIGVSQICFSLGYRSPATAIAGILVRSFQIEVHAIFANGGHHASYIGAEVPEVPLEIKTEPGYDLRQVLARVTLNNGQLFILDKLRKGGAVSFDLHISAIAVGPNGIWPQHDQVRVPVQLENWSTLLKDLGGPDYFVVEIGLPNCSDSHPLFPAVERIRRAKSLFIAGRYDTVVAECRMAAEGALKLLSKDDVEGALQEWGTGKRKMSKFQREILLLESLRHYTHLAHHVEGGGASEVFTIDDARMALATIASLVSSCVARIDSEELLPIGVNS